MADQKLRDGKKKMSINRPSEDEEQVSQYNKRVNTDDYLGTQMIEEE